MILGARVIGASDELVRAVAIGLGEHNAQWYRRFPGQPDIRSAGVRYRPDRPGYDVLFADAATVLAQGFASCGSAAASYYGWVKAAGGHPVLIVRRELENVWHGIVQVRGVTWDPEKELVHG